MIRSDSITRELLYLFLALASVIMPAATMAAQVVQNDEPPVKLSARYHIESGTNRGFLIVKVDVPAGNHIYSLNQPEPLIPTRLSVKTSDQFSAEKKFKADKKPKVVEKDPLFNARLEKHAGTVQFYVPLTVNTQSDLKQLQPLVRFSGQMCSDQGYCVPINNLEVAAKFAGYFQREAKNSVPPLKQKK
jgi:hypothetical protein